MFQEMFQEMFCANVAHAGHTQRMSKAYLQPRPVSEKQPRDREVRWRAHPYENQTHEGQRVTMTKDDRKPTHAENRQWLRDRSDGKSKYGDSRPCCTLCWVPPCVKMCPGLMEENRFCRCWGTIGFMTKKSLRYNVLLVGLIANFIGMVLTIYACFAISEDFDSLQRTSFSSGDITGGPDSSASLKVDIGLKAIAFDESRSGIKTVVGFDELCDFSFNDEFDVREFTMTDACDECNDVSSGLVATVIMSAVTFIPSLATDILRMYENYDVNCQKGFATILAIISIVSSLSTLLSYKNACFDGFFDGEIIFSVSGGSVVQNDGQGTFVVDFDWSAGNGMIALAIGTALKVIDVVCNFLVATPTITRDVYEKAEYEKLGAGGDNTGGADADNEEVANDSDASRGDELNA